VPFKNAGSLRLYQFESLDHPDLIHGVFTRRGGVSQGNWRSLNVGATVGDDPEHVNENRSRLFKALDREPESVFEVWQVHSADVVVVDEPRGETPIVKADALVTNKPHVTLLMRFADCVPILLFDPVRQAIGMGHAGWLGTTRKLAAELVRTIRRKYSCQPSDMLAAIGPSIAAHHYAVGPEVVKEVRESFGNEADLHLKHIDGNVHFDLWSANRALLEGEGVRQIENSGMCSACDPEDWYSHRGQGGKTGRFGVAMALRSEGRD
jgi:YfiH family protein